MWKNKEAFYFLYEFITYSTTANVKSSNTAAFHKWKALLSWCEPTTWFTCFTFKSCNLKVTLVGKVKRRCCYSTLGYFQYLSQYSWIFLLSLYFVFIVLFSLFSRLLSAYTNPYFLYLLYRRQTCLNIKWSKRTWLRHCTLIKADQIKYHCS